MRHLFAFAFLVVNALPANAQLVLPGAVAPTPEGATVAAPAGGAGASDHPKRKAAVRTGNGAPAAAPAKVPPITSLAGQTYYLNGRKSAVSFDLQDKAVVVTHLSLSGEKISNRQDECAVEIADVPIKATPDPAQPNGVARVALALPACPLVFDVLDGAVLANGEAPACDFKAADCSVRANGLWGPQPGTLGPDKVKIIERALTQAETSVRANFKRLLALTKDRAAVMDDAREQAAFSSQREEVCRDYAGEGRHGFCSTRLTEARAAALRAKANRAAAGAPPRKKPHGGKA
jgi:hypothetical protein